MRFVSGFIVLAIFATYSAQARYLQPEEPETPPEIQVDDPSYPTELAKNIIDSLTEEQLKLFNKDFLEDRDSESAICPFRQDEGKPSKARAEDGIEYFLPVESWLKQNFLLKICMNTPSPKCQPHLSSSVAQCRPEPKLQIALVIPVPAHKFRKVGNTSYVGDTEYTSKKVIEKMVYIENSECICECKPKESN